MILNCIWNIYQKHNLVCAIMDVSTAITFISSIQLIKLLEAEIWMSMWFWILKYFIQ